MFPCFYCLWFICLILFPFAQKSKLSVYFVLFILPLMHTLLSRINSTIHLIAHGRKPGLIFLKINILNRNFFHQTFYMLFIKQHLNTTNQLGTYYRSSINSASWFDSSIFRAYSVIPSKSLSCWSSHIRFQPHQL